VNLTQVELRVIAIERYAKDDPDKARAMELRLHRDVLQHIANGGCYDHAEAQIYAQEALKSGLIIFDRNTV
jgi:hypothetical protein